MQRGRVQPVAMVAALLALAAAGISQRGFRGGIGQRVPERDDPFETEAARREGEFHFIRMEYTDLPQHHRGFGYSSRSGQGAGWWIVDWPAADNHFTAGLQRLTRMDAGDPRHLSLTDDKLFDYPWIYATQTGWWGLSPAEIARLREYLLRGGYLMTDDFWSSDPESWPVFAGTMAQVLPNQQITELDLSDPVRHVVYDIEEKDLTWIPGSRHLRRGYDGTVTLVQPEGTKPQWFSMEDGNGHTVVAVNYNTDIGDAWEFADVPYYPENMTALAYRYGVARTGQFASRCWTQMAVSCARSMDGSGFAAESSATAWGATRDLSARRIIMCPQF